MLNGLIRFVSFCALVCLSANSLLGQGIIFPWVGPVSRSMGGATMGAPLDPVSTTYWNPAAMADVEANELGFGIDLLFPQTTTYSSFMGIFADSSNGESGVVPLPYIGWIYRGENPTLTYGLSVAAVGGAKANYSSSMTNPLFMPQSNVPGFPGGVGRVSTSAQFLQIMPSVAIAMTERLSFAVAPTVTLGQLEVSPFLFAAPDDNDGSGQPRYPTSSNGYMNWGGGFQVSSYFLATPTLGFGATYRSKQWMGSFDNMSTDELGLPRMVSVDADLPYVISVGTAYSGIERTILTLDARYIGNTNAAGFGDEGFNPDGSLAGLGFRDQYMIGTGASRRVAQRLTLAGGYTFTSSPLRDGEGMVAVFAPLHYKHVYNVGGTFHISHNTNFNFAYSYSPTSRLSGPILSPFGPVPGTELDTDLSVHVASFGISVQY